MACLMSTPAVMEDTPTAVKSELLCFVASKSAIMTFDDIVKVCASFFREDEIIEARCILEKVGVSMHKRRGDDKFRSTVEDITKAMLNPGLTLPTFYATDLNRLPPVDIKHCDVSAILAELQALRSEIRNMRQLQDEVSALRNQVNELIQASEAPNKSDGGQGSSKSFAHCAVDLQMTGLTSRSTASTDDRSKQKARSGVVRKTVIGASASNKHVASVKTFRYVDIFVSRCHPHTADSMLTDCVDVVKGELQVHDVSCTKLKNRYEHVYSSFHVQVKVASSDFKKAIDLFMSAEAWPSDLLVRRYFPPKDGEQ